VSVGGSGSYGYDSANRRVKKVAAGVTTHYVWEGSEVIAEYDGTSGALISEYVNAGRVMIREQGSAIRYYHSDRLSTRMITDGTGTVVGTEDHLPFGEDGGVAGESEKHRFTNYERDTESATDYAVNRQYSNAAGRFMRPDPIAGAINDPQSLNRYSYSLNDPVNLVDPVGLYHCPPQFASCTRVTVFIQGVGFATVTVGLDGMGGGTFLWGQVLGSLAVKHSIIEGLVRNLPTSFSLSPKLEPIGFMRVIDLDGVRRDIFEQAKKELRACENAAIRAVGGSSKGAEAIAEYVGKAVVFKALTELGKLAARKLIEKGVISSTTQIGRLAGWAARLSAIGSLTAVGVFLGAVYALTPSNEQLHLENLRYQAYKELSNECKRVISEKYGIKL